MNTFPTIAHDLLLHCMLKLLTCYIFYCQQEEASEFQKYPHSEIYIYESKGPNDQLYNQFLEWIGIKIVQWLELFGHIISDP